jgi:hypothetical protein
MTAGIDHQGAYQRKALKNRSWLLEITKKVHSESR